MRIHRVRDAALMSAVTVSLLGVIGIGPAWAVPITVTNTTDDAPSSANDGDCSLREAIHAANANVAEDACPPGSGSEPDEIILPAGMYPRGPGIGPSEGGGFFDINLGDLDITQDLIITGAGAATTVIDGQDNGRVLHVQTGSTVTIAGVTVEDGSDGTGFGGGGIYNVGTLTIDQAVVRANTTGSGSAGIRNDGTLSIIESLVTGNVAPVGSGGGVTNNSVSSSLTITNSTIHGNSAAISGGGVFVNAGVAVTLNNATVTGNTADSDDSDTGNGGGIQGFPLILRNSIVADNVDATTTGSATVHPDCSGAAVDSQGYNVIETTTGCGFTPNNDLTGIDSSLGPLADNGGPTLTRLPTAGSPVIDAGNPGGCTDGSAPLTADQRGLPRPTDGDGNGVARCDIGAVEVAAPLAPPPAMPVSKSLTLKAKPRRVESGDRTKLTAMISPCSLETQNDVVAIRRGSKVVTSQVVGADCLVKKKVKIRRKSRFQASSPADADSSAATSARVTVRVTGG